MRNHHLLTIMAIVVALGFVFSACANSNITKEMSGTWKSKSSDESIDINLAGDQKVITIGNEAVPVTVKNINEGAYMVRLDATPANGAPAEWLLRQVWNDNGSSFVIKFEHDGKEETLTRG